MSLSEEDVRRAIISKFVENPVIKYSKIAKDLKTSLSTVKRTILKYKKGISIERKPGSGKKPGPTDKDLVKKVKDQYKKKSDLSVRDMAIVAGTSKSQVQRLKKFCGLRTYKVQKVPDRSEEKEILAKRRARKLYEQYLTKFDCIVMDDETYCKADFSQLPGQKFYTSTKKSNVKKKFSEQKMTKFPKKFMIWQAICSCGFRSQEFVVKDTINSKLYINECLQKRLLPFITSHSGPVLFWPDLATSHYASNTMEWYKNNNIDIVPKEANPPNCPELRPIERYWALMKRSLKKTKKKAKNDVEFKNRWRKAYEEVPSSTVQNLMKDLKRKVRNFYSS